MADRYPKFCYFSLRLFKNVFPVSRGDVPKSVLVKNTVVIDLQVAKNSSMAWAPYASLGSMSHEGLRG